MSSLPKTPIKGDPETRRFLEAVRQKVNDVDKNALTVQDLKSAGFWDNNNINLPTTDTATTVVDAPTVPVALQTSGVFQNIILTWDFAPYRGHAYTRIYRSTTNLFANAVVIANVNSKTYADPVGPGKTYYYWVSNVNTKGVESAPNQVAGTIGQTLLDTAYILTLLNNSITESQLYSTLGDRINLIDGGITLPGSVNNRLDTVKTEIKATTDDLGAQYTVKIDNNGYVSGFGLASTAINANPTSSFIVRADRFSIASPSGPGIAPKIPFIVQTTPTVENGVTIQPGVYIDTAVIKDAAITSAKIGDLKADKITTGTLKVALGLDGDLNVGTGRIVFDSGTHMKVQGVGFGSSNQFIEWFGPKLASFAFCTEANAITYIKRNGDAYFGGSLSAGSLRNAARTTVLTVPAQVDVGPFGSNGNPRVVVLSYSFSYQVQISDAASWSGTPTAQVLLMRPSGGGYTTLATLNVTGDVTGIDGYGTAEPGFIRVQMSGSLTFTDTSGGLTAMYVGLLNSRSTPNIFSSTIGAANVSQSVGVVSTEN